MTTQNLEQYIKRKAKFAKERRDELKEKHGDTPNQKYTYYGGWDMGFADGVYNTLDDLIKLAEEKEAEVYALKEEIRHLKFTNQALVAEIDYLDSEIKEQDEL